MLLQSDRDFFLRMTSFSLALKQAERRRLLRRQLRAELPWVDTPALSAHTAEGFRDAYGAAINAAVPEADLVVVGPEAALGAVRDHADRIQQETLAESLAEAGELPHRDTFKIDDWDITIMLAKS